ncbi:MAG: N-(5'-phosphoribosyl)anthranilate isomerase [Porphyromonadaceae bacterium CG2_30_38_12]|nr:MAG: N-(5'-phosphoribosyl)anthranilate isomerase [Porphyromonadaceae bacterium CG2_30_38_12]
MKIKICGMKYPSNVLEVKALQPDFMGFIFYPKSPRYAEPLDMETLNSIPKSIKKIGVFVNEDLENILTIVFKYKLDGVQLHGAENVEICRKLKEAGLLVLKAFPIADASNFRVTKIYEGACDYFLFDTKTEVYGGSGLKFDWSILNEYKGETLFLLSGGIAPDDSDAILEINHPKFAGIDLNSKFEVKPGLKNVDVLRGFLIEIK